MTSFDPDTLVQDKEITCDIYGRFDGKLALNCFVIESGEITVSDEVKLVRGRACTESAAIVRPHHQSHNFTGSTTYKGDIDEHR